MSSYYMLLFTSQTSSASYMVEYAYFYDSPKEISEAVRQIIKEDVERTLQLYTSFDLHRVVNGKSVEKTNIKPLIKIFIECEESDKNYDLLQLGWIKLEDENEMSTDKYKNKDFLEIIALHNNGHFKALGFDEDDISDLVCTTGFYKNVTLKVDFKLEGKCYCGNDNKKYIIDGEEYSYGKNIINEWL